MRTDPGCGWVQNPIYFNDLLKYWWGGKIDQWWPKYGQNKTLVGSDVRSICVQIWWKIRGLRQIADGLGENWADKNGWNVDILDRTYNRICQGPTLLPSIDKRKTDSMVLLIIPARMLLTSWAKSTMAEINTPINKHLIVEPDMDHHTTLQFNTNRAYIKLKQPWAKGQFLILE